VETRRLNEQVKRNPLRFPPDFMFQLNDLELEYLMLQVATSSWGGIRKLPYVFPEHGLPRLSSVLNSERASQVNIQIMRIYTRLREEVRNHNDVQNKLEQLDRKIINLGHDVNIHDGELETIFEPINELKQERKK
jgi:ORF6N domain